MASTNTLEGGGRKGIDTEEYRRAAEKTGSVRGVANELGVSYSTAYGVCKRHEIYIDTLGGPPGQDGDK